MPALLKSGIWAKLAHHLAAVRHSAYTALLALLLLSSSHIYGVTSDAKPQHTKALSKHGPCAVCSVAQDEARYCKNGLCLSIRTGIHASPFFPRR